MKTIVPPGTNAVGPYSPAVVHGNLVFASGQIGIDPETKQLGATLQEQAHLACRNVSNVLQAAGSDCGKVLKALCFLTDMGNFAAFNEVYAQYFPNRPARSCVAVKALPMGALCEIETIACLDDVIEE